MTVLAREHIKADVAIGFPTAAAFAVVLLRRRNRLCRRPYEAEARNENADGVPGMYQTGTMDGGW